MTLTTLRDVLVDQLKDLHSAESQLVKALPKIAKGVSTPGLKDAIEKHLEETREQMHRIEKIGELLDCKVTEKKCKAMEGLLKEGQEALDAKGDEMLVDVGVVAAAQRVEHYEIAAYGSARTLVELLGQNDVAALLQQTLDEEKAADKKLTEVVEQEIYPQIRASNGAAAYQESENEAQMETAHAGGRR